MKTFNPFLMRHLAVYYMIMSGFYFGLNSALAKVLIEDLNSIEIVFFRNLFGVFFIFIALRGKKIKKSKGGHPFLLIFRGILGALALVMIFYNIGKMSLSSAITFQKTAPIWTTLFSAYIIKENLSKQGWFSVFLGFFGLILITKPQDGLNIYAITGILSGLFSGLAYTSVRELRKYYSSSAIILSFMISSVIVASFTMLLAEFGIFNNYKFVIPNLYDWVLILLLGGSGLYVQSYLTKAYAATKKAGIVATVSYVEIIFATIFGICLGDDLPDIIAICGILIIITSGIIIAREK